tara:strand:- start:423 stop:680 length:258 start_codon:yes stop_codon:yes gene_type:complete
MDKEKLFKKKLEILKKYNGSTLKKVLTSYNKSVRKKTYKGVSKLKRSIVEGLIAEDFILTEKKKGKGHQFKHKDKRFTKIFMKDK